MENPFSIFNEQAKLFTDISLARSAESRDQTRLNLFAQNQAFSQEVETERLGMLKQSHALGMESTRLNIGAAKMRMTAAGMELEVAKKAIEEKNFEGTYGASLALKGIDRITDREGGNAFIARETQENAQEFAAYPSARLALEAAVERQLQNVSGTVAVKQSEAYKTTLLGMAGGYDQASMELGLGIDPAIKGALLNPDDPNHPRAFRAVKDTLDYRALVEATRDRKEADAEWQRAKQAGEDTGTLAAKIKTLKDAARLGAFRQGAQGAEVTTETDAAGQILKMTSKVTADTLKLQQDAAKFQAPVGTEGKLVDVTQENYEKAYPYFLNDPGTQASVPKWNEAYSFVPPELADETVREKDFGAEGAVDRAHALLKQGKKVRLVDRNNRMKLIAPKDIGVKTGDDGKGKKKKTPEATPMIQLPELVADNPAAIEAAKEIAKEKAAVDARVAEAADAYRKQEAKLVELRAYIKKAMGTASPVRVRPGGSWAPPTSGVPTAAQKKNIENLKRIEAANVAILKDLGKKLEAARAAN